MNTNQASKFSFPCTCQEPPVVDLSSKACSKQLADNLRQFGWSPICSIVTKVSPPTHEEIIELFQPGNLKSVHPCLEYKNAESGGSEQLVEPKESLELKCSKTTEIGDRTSSFRVRDWCLAMSQIALEVTKVLGFPPGTVVSDPSQDCLDLLRVFYYHATDSPQLGSSPHTDWGSWTVVWQDDVGGLETFCRACQKWVKVSTPMVDIESDGSKQQAWRCIVHVGDMASLALCHPKLSEPSGTHQIARAETERVVQWPSPRHRVVSSRRERVSLVYFAYPPPSCSIRDMQRLLGGWNLDVRGQQLPYEEYYLLKNQAAGSERHDTAAANAAYEDLSHLSIEQVIQSKWNQVQRNSY